ncbi:MAG: hypothetical protein RH917_13425 [Lacipirellulaceae bacterium]
MHVVLLSSDLMFTSKIEGAVRTCGAKLFVTSDAQAAITSANEEGSALVMIDLTLPVLNLEDLLTSLPEGCQSLAYGPHVHEAKLAAANDAGCDLVVSRGELDRKLPTLLAKFIVTN